MVQGININCLLFYSQPVCFYQDGVVTRAEKCIMGTMKFSISSSLCYRNILSLFMLISFLCDFILQGNLHYDVLHRGDLPLMGLLHLLRPVCRLDLGPWWVIVLLLQRGLINISITFDRLQMIHHAWFVRCHTGLASCSKSADRWENRLYIFSQMIFTQTKLSCQSVLIKILSVCFCF